MTQNRSKKLPNVSSEILENPREILDYVLDYKS